MDNSPLGRLKDIAENGRKKPEKQMALQTPQNEEDDTLELGPDHVIEDDAAHPGSVTEDAEFEEINENDDDAGSATDVLPGASETERTPVQSAATDESTAASPVSSERSEERPPVEAASATERDATGDINDLIAGSLLPRVSLPIEKAGDYDVMNAMLKKGKVSLGEVDGGPHIVLTASALDDIIDEKKNAARDTVEAIEKTESEISEIEKRIEVLREERASLLDAASVSRDEISDLQKIRGTLK